MNAMNAMNARCLGPRCRRATLPSEAFCTTCKRRLFPRGLRSNPSVDVPDSIEEIFSDPRQWGWVEHEISEDGEGFVRCVGSPCENVARWFWMAVPTFASLDLQAAMVLSQPPYQDIQEAEITVIVDRIRRQEIYRIGALVRLRAEAPPSPREILVIAASVDSWLLLDQRGDIFYRLDGSPYSQPNENTIKNFIEASFSGDRQRDYTHKVKTDNRSTTPEGLYLSLGLKHITKKE